MNGKVCLCDPHSILIVLNYCNLQDIIHFLKDVRHLYELIWSSGNSYLPRFVGTLLFKNNLNSVPWLFWCQAKCFQYYLKMGSYCWRLEGLSVTEWQMLASMPAFYILPVSMHLLLFNGNTQESFKMVSAYEYLFS